MRGVLASVILSVSCWAAVARDVALPPGAAAATAPSAAAEAIAFTEYYYLRPQPEMVPRVIRDLSAAGELSSVLVESRRAAFFGALFARNPERLSEWTSGLDELPPAVRGVIWRALFLAGTEPARETMRELAAGGSPEDRRLLERLIGARSPDFFSQAVTSPAAADMILAMFSATGEPRCIAIVADALRPEPQGIEVLDEMARSVSEHVKLALAEAAFRHARVLDLCRREMIRLDPRVRPHMENIVASVEMRLGMESSPDPSLRGAGAGNSE
jgi:hypothetical protein